MDEFTVQSLRSGVEDAIAKSGETVVTRVRSHYVEAAIEQRSKLIIAGVDAVRQAETDLKKLDRPDVVHMNADGSTAAQHYSKPKFEEVKKARERLERLNVALNNVLANHNPDTYKKLEETIKKGGKGGNDEETIKKGGKGGSESED